MPANAIHSAARTILLKSLLWDGSNVELAKVESIAASFRDTGRQIAEIQVRPDGDKFRVIAGRHRCEAARKIGWTKLRAIELPYDTSQDRLLADLVEIDENLCRRNLSSAQEASAVARRKPIYEELYPKTKAGVAGAEAKHGRANEESAFAENTAEATGKSRRTVEILAKRGKEITPATLDKIVGTSLDKGDELDALAKLSEPNRDALIDRAVGGEKVSAKAEFKKQRRSAKEKALGGIIAALPTKRYGVILADPEWRFEPWSRETGMDRAADNHYPTSCLDVIKARGVPSIAADDCVLFLWAPAPMLPHALLVMAAWGFDYKSNRVWKKDRMGTGYWFRNWHEHVLVGTRGKIPAPAMGTQADSYFEAPRGEHSAKPKDLLEMIEQYFPTLPKIELNRRGPARPGWDAWGNETETEAPPSLVEPAESVPSSPGAAGSPNVSEKVQ